MKKTLLLCFAAFALSSAMQAQITDTLWYFTNKQLYKAPTFTVHPYYNVQALLTTNTNVVTHVGSVFKNSGPMIVKGLKARVLKDAFNPSIYGVAAKLYLFNVVAGLPVFPALDSVATVATSASAEQYGQTVGGMFASAKTVTNDFAVLIKNVAGAQGDVLKVFRTAGHTATSTTAPSPDYKFGEGRGIIRYMGQFYKTTDYNDPAFGPGTDYEFCLAPVVEFSLQINQIESTVQEGACCWEVFTNTNTSTPALTNRQFNLNEFCRQLKPFNPATMPANLVTDSILRWDLGDGSFYYLPAKSDTVHLSFVSGSCNQFYTGTLTGKYKPMYALSSPTSSAGLTFTSSTVYCGDGTPSGIAVNAAGVLANINVFPNPVVDKVTVSGLKGATTVFVYDLLGKVVASQVSDKETVSLDLQKLSPGNYLVKISDAENRSKTVKVVKLHQE